MIMIIMTYVYFSNPNLRCNSLSSISRHSRQMTVFQILLEFVRWRICYKLKFIYMYNQTETPLKLV